LKTTAEMKAVAAALASLALLFYSAGHARAWQTIPDPPVPDPDPQAATSSPQSLSAYMNASGEPLAIPQLGITVRDDSAKLDDAGRVSGAGVTGVSAGGASAGILDDHHVSHTIVSGALLGAGAAAFVLFPPAVIAVVMLANARGAGESLDLIIAVDGARVRNTMDLVDAVQEAHQGDTVYLTIVRNGQRKHVTVRVQ